MKEKKEFKTIADIAKRKKNKPNISPFLFASDYELKQREHFIKLYNNWPGPDEQKIRNLGLFTNRLSLMRILFMNELYTKILDVTGDAMEFGTRWGQNIVLWQNFKGIYEPYNVSRKIIGFDTFSGLKGVTSIDKKVKFNELANEGEFSTSPNYENYLNDLMDYHSSETHAHHLKRYKIIKGDASKTIKEYLKDNQQTVIALAYFDVDLYKPTKDCLMAIKPYLTKGSVIGFDEPNLKYFPGETIAMREAFGSTKYKLYTSKFSAGSGYLVIE
tara:strand:+ start:2777 stop:3595 length:819 start_codon:yes stop_codon:yes gene_type:complete